MSNCILISVPSSVCSLFSLHTKGKELKEGLHRVCSKLEIGSRVWLLDAKGEYAHTSPITYYSLTKYGEVEIGTACTLNSVYQIVVE